MSTSPIPIYRQRYAGIKRKLVRLLGFVCTGLILSYAFLVVASTAISSRVRQIDADTALLQSSIATLEVEYFTKASNIGPDDVGHLAMKQVPEDAISYLVLQESDTELASAR